jgi:hypothetical protein
MNHPDTLVPSDEELWGVVYDEELLSAEKQAHLAHCEACQQRLAAYRRVNGRLFSKLYRSACPDAVELNYYCLGGLSQEERTTIASHILDCPACADDVAEIRRQQAAFEPVPPAAFSLPAALRTAVRRIFGTLVVQQAQPVTRDMAAPAGWPRQYRAEAIDLSLHLSRASNGETMLVGIVTGRDPQLTAEAFEGVTVDLYQGSGPQPAGNEGAQALAPFLSTQVDDVGNILLEPVPPGTYFMILCLPDLEVIIEDLQI